MPYCKSIYNFVTKETNNYDIDVENIQEVFNKLKKFIDIDTLYLVILDNNEKYFIAYDDNDMLIEKADDLTINIIKSRMEFDNDKKIDNITRLLKELMIKHNVQENFSEKKFKEYLKKMCDDEETNQKAKEFDGKYVKYVIKKYENAPQKGGYVTIKKNNYEKQNSIVVRENFNQQKYVKYVNKSNNLQIGGYQCNCNPEAECSNFGFFTIPYCLFLGPCGPENWLYEGLCTLLPWGGIGWWIGTLIYLVLEIIELVLIIASSVPGLQVLYGAGVIIDVIAIIIALARLDILGALAAAVSLIPLFGDIAGGIIRIGLKIFKYVLKGIKLITKGTRYATKGSSVAVKGTRLAAKGTKATGKIGKKSRTLQSKAQKGLTRAEIFRDIGAQILSPFYEDYEPGSYSPGSYDDYYSGNYYQDQ